MTTDRLAALLHKTHRSVVDYRGDIDWQGYATRLAAAGVTVAPQPAGLDVERLLEAMRQSWPYHYEGTGSSPASPLDATWKVLDPTLPSEGIAERIAREYGVAQPAPDALRVAAQAALVCLVGQHRSVVSEWSANFGGHVAIREGWVEYDDDTTVEECPVCEAIAALRAALGEPR